MRKLIKDPVTPPTGGLMAKNMKKELGIHFGAFFLFTIIIFLFKRWFDLAYWPFLVGGIFGTILPDIDHFLYTYLLKPQELTSQRIKFLVNKKQFIKSWDLIAVTRQERKNLILHSVHFQIFFIILSFFVITSAKSLFGEGLVIAFLFHLLMDQFLDLRETGTIEHWFSKVPIKLSSEQIKYYLVVNGLLLVLFSMVF